MKNKASKIEHTASACADLSTEMLVADGYDMSTVELGNFYNAIRSYVFGYLTLGKK